MQEVKEPYQEMHGTFYYVWPQDQSRHLRSAKKSYLRIQLQDRLQGRANCRNEDTATCPKSKIAQNSLHFK